MELQMIHCYSPPNDILPGKNHLHQWVTHPLSTRTQHHRLVTNPTNKGSLLGCQKGPSSAAPVSFCSHILHVFVEIPWIAKGMLRLRREKLKPPRLQKHRVPGAKEREQAWRSVLDTQVTSSVPSRQEKTPGRAPSDRGTHLPLRFFHLLASDPCHNLLWRAVVLQICPTNHLPLIPH